MPLAALRRFSERRRREQSAARLYRSVVETSRQPVFFTDMGVADTLTGRFDLLILNAYLLLRRLGIIQDSLQDEARAVSQATFDLMFADMDQNLREIGVTDTGIGKRVRRMAEAFYGRVAAYDQAGEEGGAALAEALRRNLYKDADPTPVQVEAMMDYIARQKECLTGQSDAVLLGGEVTLFVPEGAKA